MKKIFVNMDGVLCDKTDINNISLLNQEGYFYYKRPHVDVIESLNLIRTNNNDASIVILAPVPENYKASVEVQRWLSYYMSKMVNVEVNFMPLGSSSISVCNVRNKDDVLVSNDAGDILLWQASGGKGIYLGNESFSDIGIESIDEKQNYMGIYKEMNNAAGCRKVIALDSMLIRISIQHEAGLSLYYEKFDCQTYTFMNAKKVNESNKYMNYDSVDINIEQAPIDKGKIELVNYLCGNGYCEPIEYNSPNDYEKRVYLKFDMKKLKKLDSIGAERYMELADRRPVLYDYMKNERHLQTKKYGGR